jgi:uncharacterized Zn finger protein
MAWYQHYEKTKPREVTGGIKAKSQRGAFGTTWWGERWEEILKGFNISNRLQRAKRYARKGQVVSIEVEEGRVTSAVQGSRADPYDVSIRLRPYDEAEGDALVDAFRHQPYFAAALLAGEMPPEVEDVVERAGLHLFPEREADLETDCSCPDWSNPCKHIAAVYLLLAEEFDRDPFLLFRLRGMRQGALMDRIGGDIEAALGDEDEAPDAPVEAQPLRADGEFWDAPSLPDDVYGAVETPSSHATLPKQLGKFPLWRGNDALMEALKPVYEAASTEGVAHFEADEALSAAA